MYFTFWKLKSLDLCNRLPKEKKYFKTITKLPFRNNLNAQVPLYNK